jgi:hypothetical protein
MEFLAMIDWSVVIQIIIIDLLLGGDNAVVIALACRNLHPNQRKKGIIWGTAGAIILRVILVAFAVTLLQIPFLKLVGGAPSRDLMIRSATPQGASGRVYGIVYSGIDLGASVGPLAFGILLDAGQPNWLFLGVAFIQCLIIFTAFKVASNIPSKTLA